jgi:hypothetical protein
MGLVLGAKKYLGIGLGVEWMFDYVLLIVFRTFCSGLQIPYIFSARGSMKRK